MPVTATSRSDFKKLNAANASTLPHPWNMSNPGSPKSFAVLYKASFIMLSVALGNACLSNATAAATCGVAGLVPVDSP